MVARVTALRLISTVALLGMVCAMLMNGLVLFGAYAVFGFMTVWIVKIETFILLAFGVAVVAAKWAPWVPVIVSWIDAYLILKGVVPWNSPGASSPAHQFMADALFFCSAHIYAGTYLLKRFSMRKQYGHS